jgi:hypothetical protein
MRKYNLAVVRSVFTEVATATVHELLIAVFRRYPKLEQVVANSIFAMGNERIEQLPDGDWQGEGDLQPEPQAFRIEVDVARHVDRREVN